MLPNPEETVDLISKISLMENFIFCEMIINWWLEKFAILDNHLAELSFGFQQAFWIHCLILVQKWTFSWDYTTAFLKNRISAGNYMFKVNNKNSRTRCKICSKLTIKTPEQRHWFCSGVFIVNFEQIPHLVLLFLLLTLSRKMSAGMTLEPIQCANIRIQSFIWSVFSRIQTECGKIWTRKNSVFGHC